MSSVKILAEMGIQSWQSKAQLPGAKKSRSHVIFGLINAQEQTVGYLLFDTNINLLMERKEEVCNLSNAMLGAIKLKAQPVNSFELAELKKKKVLIFGKNLAKKLQTEINFELAIAVHHPAELLQTPSLKREAWQGLQNFTSL